MPETEPSIHVHLHCVLVEGPLKMGGYGAGMNRARRPTLKVGAVK